jgi:hypothetical protein
VGKNNIIPKYVMHGSFDTKAVQKFYSFYDSPLVENFSEGGLYDFSKSGMTKKDCGCSHAEKKEPIAKKHKKAKEILDAANMKVLQDYSEENLRRLELAQKLYDLTSERYEKEKADNAAQLQYAESIGQEDIYA